LTLSLFNGDLIFRCVAENRYNSYYNFEHCSNWMNEEKTRIERRKEEIEKVLERSDSLDEREKKIKEKLLQKAIKALKVVYSYDDLCGK
jgi:hypothetical protein